MKQDLPREIFKITDVMWCGATLVFFLFFVPRAWGQAPSAHFFFHVPEYTVPMQSEVEVKIFLDASVSLNAYDFHVVYPPELLEVARVDISRSLIDIWQVAPEARTPGSIEFRGGSFTPFQGRNGELARIHFIARSQGDAVVAFTVARAYIADGKGTAALVSATPQTMRIVQDGEQLRIQEEVDTAPPFFEHLALVPDPFSAHSRLLSFLVQDSGSGVKMTEARIMQWFLWGAWEGVRHPAGVARDVLALQIRAVDYAGNTHSEILYQWPAMILRLSIVLVFFLVAGIVSISLWRFFFRARTGKL